MDAFILAELQKISRLLEQILKEVRKKRESARMTCLLFLRQS